MSWKETVALKIIELGGVWFIGLVATLIVSVPILIHVHKRCRESDKAFSEYLESEEDVQ